MCLWPTAPPERRLHPASEGSLAAQIDRSELITRALRQRINEAAGKLESGLTVLASVGSTAPFVGLFGTVWGIYHALINIGARARLRSTKSPARLAKR